MNVTEYATMADITMENAVAPEPPDDDPAIEEYHDAVTVTTGENMTLTGAEWKEIHLLLEITYKNNTEARTSPQKHMLVLKALSTAFDDTELAIYDNKNRKLSLEACKAMSNIKHYESHFNIHQGNGRHYVIFRVSSTIRFQGLKRDSAVLSSLKHRSCYMKRHLWPQDKWDIVTLGFLLEIDPGRHLEDEVREQIIALAKAKEAETPPGSRFKLVRQRFKFKHNGIHCNSDAFGIQCMRIDAKAVDTMFKNTYRDTMTYVKNKLRKEMPKAFINALRLQNRYITKAKTVPIVGITRTTMVDMRPLLLSNPNIQHVAATRKTETIGRWDIITDDEHHESVKTDITTNLAAWILSSTVDHEQPIDFPPPGIPTRSNMERDTSSQGDVSYLSSSAGSYDSLMENETDEQFNNVPAQRTRNSVSVSGFTWAQVAAKAPTSRTPSHVSELTNPTQATQNLAQQTEITDLKTEVTEMRGQLKRFEDLIILLTSRLPPANTGQQQTQVQHQAPQWPPQYPPYPQHYPPPHPPHPPHLYPPTPPRHNGSRRQDPRGPPIPNNRMRAELPPPRQLLDEDPEDGQERPAKKKDDKTTPSKRGHAQQNLPVDTTEQQIVEIIERQQIVNPYKNRPKPQPPPPAAHMQHHPSQYAHNQMDSNGNYYDHRHDALIYSQQIGQFRYTPPSQEYNEVINYSGQDQDAQMQEQATSHSAEDARNYASL
jgi:hypothetical protein